MYVVYECGVVRGHACESNKLYDPSVCAGVCACVCHNLKAFVWVTLHVMCVWVGGCVCLCVCVRTHARGHRLDSKLCRLVD
jgi:hypothetical protein